MVRLLPILALLLLSSCSDQEEISLRIGMQDNGMPFWDWEGFLYYEEEINGLVTSAGSKMKGRFGYKPKAIETNIELELELKEDEKVKITGFYESKLPFKIRLLGTSKDEENDKVFFYQPGKGEIDMLKEFIQLYQESSSANKAVDTTRAKSPESWTQQARITPATFSAGF